MIYPLRGRKSFSHFGKKVSKEYWGRKFRSRYNFWSLSVRTSEKKRIISFNPQFWVFLAAYPLRRNFFQKGVNFWRFSLPTKWRDKYFSWIGLVLDLPDAYQMGEKFSKPFIKTAISCSTTWEKKFFSKNLIFFAFPWSTPWGRKFFSSKARFLPLLTAYLLREQNFFGKHLLKRSLPVGISREKKFSTGP